MKPGVDSKPHPLVNDPGDALLIDVRPAEEFARGHIPGAVHLDLWGVSLIDTSDAPLKACLIKCGMTGACAAGSGWLGPYALNTRSATVSISHNVPIVRT